MNLVDFALSRRVTVAMISIGVTLFGAVAFTRLPINLLPELSYPSLTIETRLPGAAPSEVETLVTRPTEEAAGVVAGVQRMSSVSRPGLSQVTLEFKWGRNMDFAVLDVRQKLDLVTLPRESSKPVLLRFDPANDPIVRLYLKGSDLYLLRYLAEEVVKKDLESTDGVAAIKVNGGFEEEIQVEVDQGKLALLGLSIGEIGDRLARENINQAGGSLYEEEARYLVRSKNEFENIEDILRTNLITRDGRSIRLSDVARVERGAKRREVVTRFDDQEAVELALYKEGDANTVGVAEAVQRRLEVVRKDLPAGVELVVGSDQSEFIRSSIDEVLENAWQGSLIALVVLLLFLKNVRSTLVIGLSIPLTVIATFVLMHLTGTSLNIMSLGGLALGIGMITDACIVVLEAIYKHREAGESPFEAARKGTKEVGMAVVASTLTAIAVFLPVVFLEGIAAQLFRDQALTVSFAQIASLVVALTIIPLLAALLLVNISAGAAVQAVGAGLVNRSVVGVVRWFRGGFAALGRMGAWLGRPLARPFDAGLAGLNRAYPHLLGWALDHRALVLGAAAGLLAAALALVPSLGVDLVPVFNQGTFAFRVELPAGTPLESTDSFLAEAQEVLRGDSRVASHSAIAGGAGLALARTGAEGENVGRLEVRMARGTTSADEAAVADLLRERLNRVPEATYKFERPSVFSFRTPVEVEVYGDNLEEIQQVGDQLHDRMAALPGLVDVRNSAELGNPEVQVSFRRDQLVLLGLDLEQVGATVRNKIQGEVATRFTENEREIDIVVRSLGGRGEVSVEDVGNLILGERQGIPIRLRSVADVTVARGPSEIRRIGQKRTAVVAANLAGRSMGEVEQDLQPILSGLSLPLGTTVTLGGQYEELKRSFRSLLLALGLAVFLVYLVMASQFESLLHPFVILFTLPFGAIGVIFSLALTGTTLNAVALIGAVILAGIVVNNAIVLIDAVNQLRRENGLGRREALIQAGLDRMRPILMTTVTTVAGLVPMALGLGEGAELRAPLATTVIGGLTVGTLLTLVVIPVVYTLFDRGREVPVGRPVEDREPADGLAVENPA
ncbi:MAG: efflux RND transporter permease subunit [Thermoanaerobaculia bacterium]|nr:efflux RND transporter permease subunit [Thermoanaerobaculia bacterium]